jgi:hypothetical protein
VAPHDCLEWVRQHSAAGNSSIFQVSTCGHAVLVQQLRLCATFSTSHSATKHSHAMTVAWDLASGQ